MSTERIILVASTLLLLSIIASKASWRLGIPSLLVFLAVGMLAGSDGLGGIAFDDPHLTQLLGVVALALILFSGGLGTRWETVRPVFWSGLALSTLGVLMTALTVGWFAASLLGFSPLEGLLLGAVVSPTDAAAVFAVLRSKNVTITKRLKAVLELEAGLNDPMAVFLTLGLIRLLTEPTASPGSLIPMFLQHMVLGSLLGYGMGRGILWIVNRLRLEYDGLYPVLTLSLVLFTYGVTASLGGNGYLAVYLAGLVVGRRDFIHKTSLMHFHDGLAWLMQIAMFLTLGLLVFPSRLVPIIGAGLLSSFFLMVVARPVSVFASLLLARLTYREQLMLSWVGLRGALPIILATFPLLAGTPNAQAIFNLVFFIVLTSTLFQGTSIQWVARRLGVDRPAASAPTEADPAYSLRYTDCDLAEVAVASDSPVVGKRLVELGMPKAAWVVLIKRDGAFIVASGGTTLQHGDTLLVLADDRSLSELRSIVSSAG